MKFVDLSNSDLRAIVDDEDFEKISQFTWWMRTDGDNHYAQTSRQNIKTKKVESFKMHRIIMDVPKGKVIDHINHDGLDNRKKNLRICTHQQNMKNMKPRRGKKFKGVSERNNKFRARIGVSGKVLHLGYYDTKKEAAFAYDKAAKKYHGDFAYLNFPEGA